MLPDKMASSHSNHLFVPVTFVFCFLSPLIHASNSSDYTDSRQFEKNPAVSRHRNNIQRLPNYNWKPPDKYYGPRKELTERNLGMEFTKPEDSEQRMADPWIKKMQEISRQEREKWAAYRRNVKLTLDNVEETTKAGKLANYESITIPILLKNEQHHENVKEGLKLPIQLLKESESLKTNMELDPATLKPLVQHLSATQDNTGMKNVSSGNRFHSSWGNSKQHAGTNVDGASNKKVKSDEWRRSIKNSSEKFLRKAPITTTHQRHKDYEIKEDPVIKQNADIDYEKRELKKDRLGSVINSHPEHSISQQFKDLHILKNSTSMHTNLTKSSENNKNLNHTNGFKESPMKKYLKFNFPRNNKKENNNKTDEDKTANLLKRKSKNNNHANLPSKELIFQLKTPNIPKSPTNKSFKKFAETSKNSNRKIDFKLPIKKSPGQFSSSQNNNEENSEDNKKDETIIAARSLMWKSKEEKHDAGKKDMTEKLSHERSFHSGRWGMSASSPPAEFLKDMSRRSMHRKNEKQIEKDGKHHLFGQWGMSVASPPKEYFEDISMRRGHETERFTKKRRSRPSEIKRSFDNRSPVHQNHRNLQATLAEQLMADEHYKKLVGTLLGKVPNGLYDSRYPDLNDLFLGFLQALQSYRWQDDMDIPMSCRIRIPYALSRI